MMQKATFTHNTLHSLDNLYGQLYLLVIILRIKVYIKPSQYLKNRMWFFKWLSLIFINLSTVAAPAFRVEEGIIRPVTL